jgi:hypothetical protein
VAELEPRFRADALEALAYACGELLVDDAGGSFFAYCAGSTVPIHNSSMLLVGASARAGDEDILASAAGALEYTLERQRRDGTWPYGEGDGLAWVDGFHTAYILDALAQWHEAVGDARALGALERGLDAYLERLVDPDGAARATLESRFPVDAHALAWGIAILARLAPYDARALPTARRMAGWTLERMRRSDGRFAFRQHARWRNPVPYVRWSDTPMLLGLAELLTAERRVDGVR